MREIIRDADFRIIGYIETLACTGRVKVMNSGFRTLGWYLPDRDVTTDARWHVIGRGNHLQRLFPCIHKQGMRYRDLVEAKPKKPTPPSAGVIKPEPPLTPAKLETKRERERQNQQKIRDLQSDCARKISRLRSRRP